MPDSETSGKATAPSGRTPAPSEKAGAAKGILGERRPFLVGFFGGLGLMCAVVLFLAIREAASLLLLMIAAAFLAIGLNPAVVWLRRRGLSRGLAVAVVAFAGLLVACCGLFSLAPPLIGQTTDLVNKLPAYLDAISRDPRVAELNDRYDVIDRIKEAATAPNIARALGGAFGGVKIFFGALFNVLTTLLLTIYFLAGFERIKHGAYGLLPASKRPQARELGDRIFDKIGAYLLGSLAIALLAGMVSFAFLLIVGVAYAFALAVVVAVCDLIPQIGAMLGAVVVSIAGFATSVPVGIACLVFFVLYQQLENWLIAPKVMKRSVDVSDLAVIVSALIGAVLLGAVGALIAIPVVAAVQLIARELFIPRQEQK